MHFNVQYFIFMFVCVSGYKIQSVTNNLNDDNNYSHLITNQSTYDASTNNFESDQNVYQRNVASSTSIVADDDDVRSEALIKKFHPFVYPKQFNVVDRPPVREFNATNENLLEIRNVENNQPNAERFDDNYGTDHKFSNIDMIPMASHISKHGHFPYFDRPSHHNQFSTPGNCHHLLGILQCTDLSLLLMGILGFVAFVLNAVLGLVDRLNLPLLSSGVTAAGMSTTATNAPITKALFGQRQSFDERTAESHHRLLTDFERILQMAIEAYEHKINSI